MSSGQTYRERGDRDRDTSYRGDRNSGYNNRGGSFRGRGSGYRPRRYWDNDEYYKEDRERGGRRRRRSYSRSRSRSHSRSYSSGSRSRSHTPPPKRGRSSRSRSPPRVEEYVPRTAAELSLSAVGQVATEPYVPSKDPPVIDNWSASRVQTSQEYVPQVNGQVAASVAQVNPYGNIDPASAMYSYIPGQSNLPMSNQAPPVAYGYGQQSMSLGSMYQNQPIETSYPQLGSMNQVANIPQAPSISETKPSKEESGESKKKKDKRKKKKRHHSSSSSSSSSDDSETDSRRRRKSKKDRGTSNSSSDEDKKTKETSQPQPTGGLTTQQKNSLLERREEYQTKLEILEREIKKLQSKEDDLIRGRADRQLIDENLKLQAELKGRCKAVLIVLEKIDDVLQVTNKPVVTEKPKPAPPPPPVVAVASPHPKISHSVPEVRHAKDIEKGGGFTAYDYFDNGQHWCRLCNVFPEKVEQMLEHFHSKEHHDQIQQLGIDEKPWHKRNSNADSKPVPGARKAPFRGMQFFSPVEGWYCRLCNSWMGDPHCAVEHLKSDEHNSNYMNFLEEHPDWEKKWVSDREKALGTSGKQDLLEPTKRPSRFRDDPRQSERSSERIHIHEDMESGKSIRVQMRNSLKTEEKIEDTRFAAPLHEPPVNKDSALDEWMTKPKVTVDLIDTQKFAAIVRQKHGAKEKEGRDIKNEPPAEVKAPPAPPVISQKDRDRDAKRDDRRRTDKVEMQISSRDKDRDRYRERDRESRSSRRRSRSRSRSRSRDRRYNRRRSRSRSRSRSRDRSDRDHHRRGDKAGERERPDFKETVKKLPMIGKMPLYKRPALTKEKPDAGESKSETSPATEITLAAAAMPSVKFLQKESTLLQPEETSRLSMYSDSSVGNPAPPPYVFDTHAATAYGQVAVSEPYGLGATTTAYGTDIMHHVSEAAVAVPEYQPSTEPTEDIPGVEVKDAKEGAPTGLPDDFQQALDIIYSANMGGSVPPGKVPQPVPPPSEVSATNGVTDKNLVGTVNEYGSEYGTMSSNGYGSYMGYQPYQQSFDGYAPYEDLDDGPPGVGDDHGSDGSVVRPPPSMGKDSKPVQAEKAEAKDPPPPGDDDMEDLRMLGIDVDDTAASSVRH